MVNIDFYKEMVYNGNKKFIEDNYLLCAIDLQPEDIDNISEGNECLMEYKKNLERINDNEDFVKWMSAEEEAEIFERTRISVAEEKGTQQGEKNKQFEIAKNMLSKELDINLISEVTGLTKEEISKLK